ncbi:aspartate-semialdehyde dehydrogenase [Ophidiomyces ophidiicola]|uniref:aspartate-semialdehyde dehydrogenase n=1 Tax=Ophidiomyces ophidiicola TaxID=1387563 RepID=UPI0020C533A8|nr:aspartate-semialdehyde dehydrogenase [Ophidiomyces ophidiicola]KAI1916375.1 aspartate-semialdehyde dehydrogenase [Ophidiomyces ophidiicola]KAI1923811.1 aspartate-semialdehyde dehydrogenase [Ophidiomyces ophidiicola]KAI1940307.1 aspartate-semialdehyde dehydrogenase [Ophidiomyces ophidiicola]KAI1958970.1 aspartate-semialdehyde dehydrogenase [Ophidiomyces ophidiicola]KAI1976502.1 aspartate-semialdehyde dehydrogenase [Ophidiomyces ophidiicola]
MSAPPKKRCAVLGATGAVGTRFILLLEQHPLLELVALGASDRSAGKTYRDAVRWKQSSPMPAIAADLIVRRCIPTEFSDCEIIFSGLDPDAAGEIELSFLKANFAVFSNAKNYRLDPVVPLVVPLVNAGHLEVIPWQRKHYGLDKGMIVCNSNCAVVGLVIPAKALIQKFGPIDAVSMVTMQAVSGAGYPGVSSMDIFDNIVPYIPGEEGKISTEARKILGDLTSDLAGFSDQTPLKVSVACNRVPVLDGHTVCVSLRFMNRPAPTADQVRDALRNYTSEVQVLGCPSAPKHAIHVLDEVDRPQPRLDRGNEGGYACTVGRIREDDSGVFDIQFVALSHNTILGASGSSILNAESAILKGYI